MPVVTRNRDRDGRVGPETSARRSKNASFLSEISGTPGWLNNYTALCVMELLHVQEAAGCTGSLLEIGVYAGRFSSILARDAFRRGSRLVGIDPFTHFPLEDVRLRLEQQNVDGCQHSGGRVDLVHDVSGNWTADRLLEVLGERARFAHIDGSHDRADVLWDLHICESVLTAGGIIAIDDWPNLRCVGVLEATFQFFQQQPRATIPFALVPGKLLLCGRGRASAYKQHLESFAIADQAYDQSKRFRERMNAPNSSVRQSLFGSEILVIV